MLANIADGSQLIHIRGLILLIGLVMTVTGCWSAKKSELNRSFKIAEVRNNALILFSEKTQETVSLATPVGEDVLFHWYENKSDQIALISFGRDVSCAVPIAGNTQFTKLMLKVKHLVSGQEHNVYFSPDPTGNFSYHYLLKDGRGKYRFLIYAQSALDSARFEPVVYFTVNARQVIPVGYNEMNLNQPFLEHLESLLGTVVGTGDCWDIVQLLMESHHADWIDRKGMGIPVNRQSEDVLPGDIIWFEKAVFETDCPGLIEDPLLEQLGDPDHFAIIYRVKGRTLIQVAHQNVDDRSVISISDINLNKLITGKVHIYRPIIGMIPGV